MPVPGRPAGVRWTEDKKEFDFQTFQDEHETIGVIPLIDVSLDDSWSDVGGGASIQYTISPDAMLYASYNRGFKGGAYNGSRSCGSANGALAGAGVGRRWRG